MRITRQTDYGIVLLTQMALRPPTEVHTARDASARSGLPLPMVSKILKCLARAGILVSQRGVKGGYSLARRADRISVEEIIRALEGPVHITECTHGPGSCDQEESCPTRVNWQRINVAIREALQGVTLAEMASPAPGQGLLRVRAAEARGVPAR